MTTHRSIELVKANLAISNYAISQTSLEQVFIHFASIGQMAEVHADEQLKNSAPPQGADDASTAQVVIQVKGQTVSVVN